MNTGSQIVDEITQIKFEGNIIPNTWYCHIKRTPDTIHKKNKRKTQEYRTDILAINILSDIIYWYRASETRDENSGKTIAYKKKFKSDKYQKWYSSWMDMFGVTKRQMQLAIKTLIDLQLIEREVRNITTDNGLKLTGVTYFNPIPENIKYINMPVTDIHLPIYHVMTPLQNSKGVVTKLEGGGYKIVIDTENTTKNTTKNTTNTVKENLVGKESVPEKEGMKDSVLTTPNSYTVSVDEIFLKEGIEKNKEKDFRCRALYETLLNRAESAEFSVMDNIGDVAKFKDKLFRYRRKYDTGEISCALELYAALPVNSLHRRNITEYIKHECQKWDFSETRNENTVKGQFILEYILWHPVYAHFKVINEKGLLQADIDNYSKRNTPPANKASELTELEQDFINHKS